MNINKSQFWLILLVLVVMVSFISCEKEVKTGSIPEFEQKLVISAFISPADTASTIYVSSNKRIYGDLGILESLGNLTVSISDDTKEIDLSGTTGGFKFNSNNFKIEEGKTYNLKVTSSKGLTAEASCIVPYRRQTDISVDTSSVLTGPAGWQSYRSLTATISIMDYPGEENYYRVFCRQDMYFTNAGKSYHSKYYHNADKNEYSADKGKDGEKIDLGSYSLNSVSRSDSGFLSIFLLNTNKAYYDYHLSLQKYSGGEDPFTEVSPVYTNIKGGLGIFAAYTIDSLVFRIK
jgi:hypothetical protein